MRTLVRTERREEDVDLVPNYLPSMISDFVVSANKVHKTTAALFFRASSLVDIIIINEVVIQDTTCSFLNT